MTSKLKSMILTGAILGSITPAFAETLPFQANLLHEEFNRVASNHELNGLTATFVGCSRNQSDTASYCRYRFGEHSVVTVVADTDDSEAREIALTSYITSPVTASLATDTVQVLIIVATPDLLPEQRSGAYNTLLDKHERARRRPSSPQQVSQNLQSVDLTLYQDTRGNIHFNISPDR